MRNNWHELGSAFFGTFAFTVPRKRRWDSSELDLDFVEDSFREQQNGSVEYQETHHKNVAPFGVADASCL